MPTGKTKQKTFKRVTHVADQSKPVATQRPTFNSPQRNKHWTASAPHEGWRGRFVGGENGSDDRGSLGGKAKNVLSSCRESLRKVSRNSVNCGAKRKMKKNHQQPLTSVADPIDFPSRKRHQSASGPTSQLKSG